MTTAGFSVDESNTNISQCTAEIYTGNTCQSVLQSRQCCLLGICGSTDIFIPSTGRQEDQEAELIRLLGGLQLLIPSLECQAAVVPFICFFTYGLCDNSSSDGLGLLRPSQGECEIIMTQTCVREFEAAVNLIGSENLPQCQQLPVLNDDCRGKMS